MKFTTRLLTAIIAAYALAVFPSAQAEEQESTTESTLKVDELTPKNKKVGDIDEEITNARMRAESGSKSKYSLSLSAGYSGGTIRDPLGKDRPDIIGNPEEETSSEMGGSFSARYRATQNDSFTLGAGFGILTPLQGDVVQGQEQFDVSNPYIGYNRVYKIGQFQTITGASFTYGTAQSYENLGGTGTDLESIVSLSHNMLTTLGAVPELTLGASVAYSHYIYNNNNSDSFTYYRAALYPYAEYALSDKYQLRTVFGYFNYRHLRNAGDKSPLVGMQKQQSYQSVGLNMVLTRDIFVYPNIQFVPDDIDAEKTNVAVSATLNVF